MPKTLTNEHRKNISLGLKNYHQGGNGYFDSNGYRRRFVNEKEYYEHRLIMENYLGRKLLSTECVHHINYDRTDNKIENLQLMSNNEHAKMTIGPKKYYPEPKKCKSCDKDYKYNNKSGIKQFNLSKYCSNKCKYNRNRLVDK